VIRGGPGISGKRQPAAGRGGREVSSQSRVNREIIGDAATELSLATYQRGSPRSSGTIARRDEITKRYRADPQAAVSTRLSRREENVPSIVIHPSTRLIGEYRARVMPVDYSQTSRVIRVDGRRTLSGTSDAAGLNHGRVLHVGHNETLLRISDIGRL